MYISVSVHIQINWPFSTMQDQLCIEQTLYEPFGPAPTPVVKSYEEFAKDEEDLAFFIPAVPF